METKRLERMFITFADEKEISAFVNVCNRFDDAIDICSDKRRTDAKSLMGVLSLPLNTELEIIYECFDDEDNYQEFREAVKETFNIKFV